MKPKCCGRNCDNDAELDYQGVYYCKDCWEDMIDV